MKMSSEEVKLTLRDMGAGLLRSYIVYSGLAVLKLEPQNEMAGVGASVMFPVETLLRVLEEGYRRDTIPAPAAAKKKTRAALVRINAELKQLFDEVFADE
jgi:hypothetical protein